MQKILEQRQEKERQQNEAIMRAQYKQILEQNVPEEMRIQYKSNCRWVEAGITEENPRSRQNFINTTSYFVDCVCNLLQG